MRYCPKYFQSIQSASGSANFAHVRKSGPHRGDEFFEYHRNPECIEIWRQMIDNMGGGFPLTLFASAAFLLLSYKEQGHDLDAELEALHEQPQRPFT